MFLVKFLFVAKIVFFFQHIYHSELENQVDSIKTALTMKIARRAMVASRQKSIPSCPRTIEEVVALLESQSLPDMYNDMYLTTVFHDQRDATGAVARKHAIVLVNRAVLEDVFRTCKWFAMDGTFKVTPRVANELSDRAAQLLTISTDYHGKAVVVFVVVMQSRKMPLYKKVFRAIKLENPDFNPGQMMSDYERAMRNGFLKSYPTARLFGCR